MAQTQSRARRTRKTAAKPVKPVWRTDRITKDVDANTGRRIVELPDLSPVGISDADRDAIFAFEAEHIGTVKAVIRMNKRLAGTLDTLVTHRLQAAGIPTALAAFYA